MDDLWMTLVKASAPIVSAFACWALAVLGRWIQARTKSEITHRLLAVLAEAVSTAVAQTEQTFVRENKALPGMTPRDKLSENDANRARMIATSRVSRLMSDQGLRELAKVLGVSVDRIEGYLGDKIEAEVLALKGEAR